jgi:hypothetical protein
MMRTNYRRETEGEKMQNSKNTLLTVIIELLEAELEDLAFGTVTLAIHLHDGKPRFVIGRERSIVPEKATLGTGGGSCV